MSVAVDSSSAVIDYEPHSLDGWLAVKENLFKPEVQAFKLRPNIHVCWNRNENKFCITFNEHSRVKSDTNQRCSFADLFGLDDLKHLRTQFSYLCGQELDERYFPSAAFSESVHGDATFSWLDYFFRSKNFSPEIMDKLCIPLEEYLSEAYRRLTHFTFLSVLYPDDFDFDQYFENLSELRHKTYLDRLERSKRNLDGLLKTREEQKRSRIGKSYRAKTRRNSAEKPAIGGDVFAESVGSTFEPAVTDLGAAFCDQLKDSVWDLLEISAEYFTYLKQPFLDMRELAAEKIRHAKGALKSADYGDRVKMKLKERLPHWQLEYSNSVENLRDLQLQYFEECKRILQRKFAMTQLKPLIHGKAEDIKLHRKHKLVVLRESEYRDGLYLETRPPHFSYHFTTMSFKEQMLDAERRLAFENVNYWTAVSQRLKVERKQVISQAAHVDVTTSNLDEIVRRLENGLFRVQARYIEANVQLLHEKDQYLKMQLKEIRHKAVLTPERGDQDGEDIFYDAVESELELQRFLEMYSSSQPRLYALKTELETVNRQKANLRNKKKRLEALKRDGNLLSNLATLEQSPELKKVIEVEQQRQVQLRDDRVKQQRVTTLQRIKDYRTKNPALSRTSSRSSLSSVTSNRTKSSSSSRTVAKAKSPEPTAAQRKISGQIRAATRKQNPQDDLWSVPTSPCPLTNEVVKTLEPKPEEICATYPVQPPQFQAAAIPPAPPPPPPAPPILQSPTAFFVPFADGAAPKKPTPTSNAPMDSILHAIKTGVQLKRVDTNELEARRGKEIAGKGGRGTGDIHSQLLKELMNRMNKMAMVSSSDSESDSETRLSINGTTQDAEDEFDD